MHKICHIMSYADAMPPDHPDKEAIRPADKDRGAKCGSAEDYMKLEDI